MTETIEQKALALLNEVRDERGFRLNVEMQREDMAQEALCRAIEQHEAFRQEVSDAVTTWHLGLVPASLQRFIIPQPDPLVEALEEVTWQHTMADAADSLRKALAARGLELVKKEPSQ